MQKLLMALIMAGVAISQPGTGWAKPKHCPPGLAKKSPACVPPGQAARYGIGDRVDDRDFVLIADPDRYGLERRGAYIRVGDFIYRVDDETRKVINLIGAIADLAN